MAIGYLVTLGDGSLDSGDTISGTQSTFTEARALGTGSWTWTGVWDGDGNTYTDVNDTGVYYSGTDGAVYFIPDTWFTTSGTATVTTAPLYTPDGEVTGTAGDDTINASYTDNDNEAVGDGGGEDIVYAGDGNDTVETGAGNDRIFGERGNDSIDAGSGNDSVYGGGGSDTLNASTGADTVYGGSGDDIINAEGGADVVFAGSGSDTINGGGGSDEIRAGSGNDVITDTGDATSNDTIFGESGNDSINAGDGTDVVDGGSGDDTIDGGAGIDTIQGGTGNDSILGGANDDVLIGDSNIVAVTGSEALNWTDQGSAGTDLNGAFSQDTGSMTVSVEVTNDGNADRMEVSNTAQYTEAGEPFNSSSSLILTGGAGATSTTAITFDPNLNTGLSDEVENVSFRINDIDTSGWQDIVTVNAYDADGNAVTVTLTPAVVNGDATDDTVVGNTITAGSTSESASSAQGSVLVEIAGPVHDIEIVYANASTAGQALWITDIHFDTTAIDNTENGNDTIDGGDGADYIEGNGGDDSIVSGAGNDTVYAGDGNDTVGDWSTDNGNDTIFGGAGNDTLNGGNGDDTLYGGAGDDVLTGASNNDLVFGGTGSDQINVTDDHEGSTIEGGEDGDGSDIDRLGFYNFEGTDGVTVTATGDEAGTFDYDGTVATGTFTEIERVETTDFDDTVDMSLDGSGIDVSTYDGDDSVIGGAGDDVIVAGIGADTIQGGAGNDQISLGDEATNTPDGDEDVVVLEDGFGDDIITNFDAPTVNVDGSLQGVDTLDVTNLTDGTDPVNVWDVTVTDDGSGNAVLTFPNGESVTLVGIPAADADNPFYLNAIGIPLSDGTVEGTAGADTIGASYTGDPDGDMVDAGDAILAGDTGDDDLIYGYGGNDNIYAGAGDDEIYGGEGNDLINAGSGNDTLTGDAGNDTFISGSGNDTVYGGTGDDEIWASIGADETYGGAGNDTLSAGGFAGTGDTMDGGADDDTLIGGSGDDSMIGGTGDDTFNVASTGGDDTIQGSADVGNTDVDTLNFSDANGPDGVSVTMAGNEFGSYDFAGESGEGDFSEIEQFNLTDQDDTFDGTAVVSGTTVDGGAGDDALTGGDGTDSFDGGSGNDTLSGLDGEDTIEGGDGDDLIAGDATAPTAGVSQGDAGQLYLDVANVRAGSETGTPGDAQTGDSVIFDNAATLADGTIVAVRVTVTSISDPDVTVDLTEDNEPGAPIRVNGNGDATNAGSEVEFQIEFFNQVTGEPITIDGQATVTDIDDNTGAGQEFVRFDEAEVSSYTVAPGTSVTSTVAGGTVTGTGTEGNNAADQDAWFGVGFENRSELTMTVGVVEDSANYGFSGSDITGGVTTAVDGGADDSLSGGAGDDYILGNGGNDVIDGGADNDTLDGGSGQDTLTGGDGADTIVGGADEDVIYGGAGDVIDGSETGVDVDTLYVEGVANIIYDSGNPENGTVQFLSGPDLVFTNIENVIITDRDGTVSGTGGDDVIGGGYADPTDGDTIDAGDALITGHNPNDDLIEAGAGNDQIDASLGADTVFAGTGDDLIYAGADASADTVFGEAGDDTMFGFDGDDELYGGADNDIVDGDEGNDSLYGGTGNDQLIGDGGTDTIFAGDGNDTIYAGADDDTIYGAEGDDLAYGGAGADTMELWVGNDTAYGGEGNDYIDGAQGNDELHGGDGNDTVLAGSDDGDDTLFGDAGDDTLSAGEGEDTLYGGTGDDTQFGAGGDDIFVLENAFGNDTITGGETDETNGDILDASAVTTNVTVDLSTLQPGNPEMGTITSGGDTATFEEIETIVLGSGDDSVIGSSGNETIDLGTGADTINAGAGDDLINLGDDGAGTAPDGDQDLIVLEDGFGNDTIQFFDAPTANVDGTFTGIDKLDVTNLLDAGGDPVNTNDVTVTDDGSGNAVLTFPNGESITLQGIDPTDADNPQYLTAIGIPLPDGTVSGTTGDDLIDAGYAGDPDGDFVDNSDAILAGDSGDDDLIEAGEGNDSVLAGAGNDEVYGDNNATGTLDWSDVSVTNGDGVSVVDGSGNSVDVTITGDGVVRDSIYNSGDYYAPTTSQAEAPVSTLLEFDSAVENVTFELYDVDSNETTFDDQYTIIALDADGVAVPVTFSDLTHHTVSGNTVEGNGQLDGGGTGSQDAVTVTIPAAIVSLEIIFEPGSYTATDGTPNTGLSGIGDVTFDIIATDGNDTLDGQTGDDTLYGGGGDDVLYDSEGDDTVFGGSGDDTLGAGGTLSDGSDELFGGAGEDAIFIGNGGDTAYGGDDADVITSVGSDFDKIAVGGEGGDDNDTLTFADETDAADTIDVSFTGDEAGVVDIRGQTVTFSEIENIVGTQGDDTINANGDTGGMTLSGEDGEDRIFGGAGDDEIYGGADDDLLSGRGGNDTVFGGTGDDELTAGPGNDSLFGGDGDDIFQTDDASGNITVVGGETGEDGFEDILNTNSSTDAVVTGTGDEAGTMTTGSTVVTFSEIEEIQTDSGNDTVDLSLDTTGMDVLTFGGNDTVTTGSGDDFVLAGTGDDTIDGNEGADSIVAGTGDDTVIFAEGDDVDGGAGDDLFVLEDLGEVDNNTITIDGGSGDETTGTGGGDTLQLGDLAVLTQDVRDTFVDDGTGSFSGSITLDDGTILNFSEIENIICFTPQTRIATPKGLVAIEDLEVGDMVVTRDHGLQPIRWIEGRTVPAVDRFAPVRIRKNVLAGQDRDLIVSPQHRVLFQGYRAELLFGESEVLVSAKHLVDGMDVTQDEAEMVTYVHMLFDQHEIVFAEGAATESFHPGDVGFSAVGDAAREELFAIFPELREDPNRYGNTARRCLKKHEAKLIRI